MGSYQCAAGDGTCQWSDGIYAIHGFHRGEVVPTTTLLLSHAHAADRRRGDRDPRIPHRRDRVAGPGQMAGGGQRAAQGEGLPRSARVSRTSQATWVSPCS
jgi:hypothetical protein